MRKSKLAPPSGGAVLFSAVTCTGASMVVWSATSHGPPSGGSTSRCSRWRRCCSLVSRGGSNEEAFEGFSWGEVVQGGAGAFTRVLRRWRSGRAGAGVPGCPWGGTPGSVRLCSRCCLVAMGCGDRRSRPACRWPRYRAAWPVHLATLVPGQGAFHQIGQPVDVVDQRVAHPGGVLALGQGQDRHEPGGAPPPG